MVLVHPTEPSVLEMVVVDNPIYQKVAAVFARFVIGETKEQWSQKALGDMTTIKVDNMPLSEFREVVRKFPIPGLVIPDGLEFGNPTRSTRVGAGYV